LSEEWLHLSSDLEQIPLIAPVMINSESKYTTVPTNLVLHHLIKPSSPSLESEDTERSVLGSPARFVIVNQSGGLKLQENNFPLGFLNLYDEFDQVSKSLQRPPEALDTQSIPSNSLPTSPCTHDPLEELKSARQVLEWLPSSSSCLISSASNFSCLIPNLITDKPPYFTTLMSASKYGLDKTEEKKRTEKRILRARSEESLLKINDDSLVDKVAPPTLIRRGLHVQETSFLDDVDKTRLWTLLNASFRKNLKISEFETRLQKDLDSIILAGDYQGAAIMTREGPQRLPYLDKFAVDPKAQGMGVADILWSRIKARYPDLFWRSRCDNPVNKWYFERSDGNMVLSGGYWMLFWYGSKGLVDLEGYTKASLDVPASFEQKE
jgi:amino-acid N-acetyltransferase